jgi:hypothetical protein
VVSFMPRFTLPLGKEPVVPSEEEAGRAWELSGHFGVEKNSSSAGNSNPAVSSSGSYF